MKTHLVVIIATALAAVTCGATLLPSLFRQLAWSKSQQVWLWCSRRLITREPPREAFQFVMQQRGYEWDAAAGLSRYFTSSTSFPFSL
jgi:hypothetical protein